MPRPSIAAERREEILQAFETCALRQGLDATTLADVAREAGLPRPLVRHFMGNRADLVSGLIDRMMVRATEAVDQALAAAQVQDSEDVLQAVLNTAFVDPTTNRLMIQLWQQSWTDDALHDQLQDVYRRCVEQIRDRLYPDATPAAFDSAYALAAMALGHAVFQQFEVQPNGERALMKSGKAVAALPTQPVKKRISR